MNTTFTSLFGKLAKYIPYVDPMRCLENKVKFNGWDSGVAKKSDEKNMRQAMGDFVAPGTTSPRAIRAISKICRSYIIYWPIRHLSLLCLFTTEALFFGRDFFSRNYFDSLSILSQKWRCKGNLAVDLGFVYIPGGCSRISEPSNICLWCPACT